MPLLFIYLLKLSVSLGVVFLFYHFVLRRLTFYNWNRWYLLGYSLLSFVIALVDITPVLEQNEWSQNSMVQWVPVIQASGTGSVTVAAPATISVWQWMVLFIIAGMLVMLVRLLFQLISFHRILQKAEPIASAVLPGTNMRLYQVNEDIIPFSFGNSIFINHHQHSKEELREIVWHEFIHVKQKHSIDIIAGELICLLNWFNPFAWLLRRSIRQNLEFIADDKVLANGVNRKEYQYLLLKVIGNKHFSIAPKFNFSSLKKRIAMMNKMKSAGVHLVKFLFILPLIAVLLVAFRNQYEANQQSPVTNQPGNARDTIPEPDNKRVKMPKEIAGISVIQTSGEATVSDAVKQKTAGMVVIKRTDGQKEVYDLDNKESMEKFEKRYGVKLEDIVPPPPPTPVQPAGAVPGTIPLPPTPPAPPVKSTGENDITRAPEASGWNGMNFRAICNEYEITDKNARMTLKDGTVENYDLTNKDQKAAFEKKYGKIYTIKTDINTNVAGNVNTNVTGNVNTNIYTTVPDRYITIPDNISTNLKTNVNTNVTTNLKTSVNTNVRPVLTPAPPGSSPVTITTPVKGMVTPAALTTTASGTNMMAPVMASLSGNVTITDDYGPVITGNEAIVITITRNTTRQELEKFKSQMKEKGVDLDFDDIEYNAKGKLVTINGTMRSGDSRSNFSATDFASLVLAMIRKGDKTWFKVSTKDREES